VRASVLWASGKTETVLTHPLFQKKMHSSSSAAGAAGRARGGGGHQPKAWGKGDGRERPGGTDGGTDCCGDGGGDGANGGELINWELMAAN
jgi:hypothetical protein